MSGVLRLAVLGDDPTMLEWLVAQLGERGHDVRAATTDPTALVELVDDPPDAVIIDLGLGDPGAMKLLEEMRTRTDVPAIVSIVHDGEAEIVRTLDAGADHYVVKPFSAEDLEARLNAVLRRVGAASAHPIEVGALHIAPSARVATLHGEHLDLTRKEFDLLAYLAKRAGRVISKHELLAAIWHQPHGGPDKTVDVHLSWLRRKLGETAAAPRYLQTVRGVGIKLVDPDLPEH